MEPYLRFLLGLVPLAVALGLVVVCLGVPAIWSSDRLAPLLRPCVFREVTSIPCPFCGGTRSVVAASQGRIAESLRLSPLGLTMTSGAVLAGLWCAAVALSGRWLGLAAAARATARGAPRLLRPRVLIAALALAWLLKLAAWLLWGG